MANAGYRNRPACFYSALFSRLGGPAIKPPAALSTYPSQPVIWPANPSWG